MPVHLKLRFHMSVCFSLLLANSEALSSSVAREQLVGMSLEQLMNVEVFTAATLIPTHTAKAPGTVYSFSQSDFRRYGVRRLDDLLQFVPGFQVNQYRKRHRSLWARGLQQRYNNKMVLLIDGVRQQHLYYGHFSLGEDLPLERIDKVEVILGAASSVHGANAFSGLISVTTRNFSEQAEAEMSFEIGSNDRAKITGLYNSPNLQVFASYLEQEAPFDENRLSFIGSETLQPLDEDYQSLQIKAQPYQGLNLSLGYRKSETPFVFIPSTQDAFVESEFISLSGSYKTGDLAKGLIELQAYYQQDDGREFEREQVTQTLGYEEFQDSVMSGISVNVFRQFSDHTLAVGMSAQYEEAKNTQFERRFSFSSGFLATPITGDLLSDPGVHHDDYALFVQDVWTPNDSIEVTLGVRYDDFSQFDEYINYRAALVYSPQPSHIWKLLYGTAIRTPNFREYLKVLEGTTFTAPIPEAESLKSIEVGYGYLGTQWDFNVTAYYNNYEDSIQEKPTPDHSDEYFDNEDGGLMAQGVELRLSYERGNNWDFTASASYIDSSSDEFSDLPYLASWSASLLVGYQWLSGHRIGLSAIYNDSRPDLNAIEQDKAESFVVANIFGSGSLSSTLAYEFGVDNLLDEIIYDPAADFGGQYNNEKTRRQVWLKLQWSPQW
jgi:outer membrane receptor protein involved in Fe transport